MKTVEYGEMTLLDLEPTPQNFSEELGRGLRKRPKQISCKFFYDAAGSRLFDRICARPEYYPTRTEFKILRQNIREIAACLGPRSFLVELGSGSSTKTRVLLDRLEEPAIYMPVDISRAHLIKSSQALTKAYPGLQIVPVCADYTQDLPLDFGQWQAERRTLFFPGSTIGNFEPEAAGEFLGGIAAQCQIGDGLLIGVDLKKDPVVLHRAYNDSQGVTAAFNLNLLARANRELRCNFDLDQFAHHAFYNEAHGRVEMHLVSRKAQEVRLGRETIAFARGEHVVTEYSYKYTVEEFEELAYRAGYELLASWCDPQRLFSVHYFAVRSVSRLS